MSNSNISIALVVVALIAIGAYFYPSVQSSLPNFGGAACNGGNCTDFDAVNTSEGYYVDDVQVVNGTGGFIGTVTGPISQTTSNTATSTAIMGCIQTYATSTATAIRFVIGNNLIATTTFGGTSVFDVYAQYGTCPH